MIEIFLISIFSLNLNISDFKNFENNSEKNNLTLNQEYFWDFYWKDLKRQKEAEFIEIKQFWVNIFSYDDFINFLLFNPEIVSKIWYFSNIEHQTNITPRKNFFWKNINFTPDLVYDYGSDCLENEIDFIDYERNFFACLPKSYVSYWEYTNIETKPSAWNFYLFPKWKNKFEKILKEDYFDEEILDFNSNLTLGFFEKYKNYFLKISKTEKFIKIDFFDNKKNYKKTFVLYQNWKDFLNFWVNLENYEHRRFLESFRKLKL